MGQRRESVWRRILNRFRVPFFNLLEAALIFAGTARTDITPSGNVWMDGMIRAHPSCGILDPLFARALVLTSTKDLAQGFAITSVDVCALDENGSRG